MKFFFVLVIFLISQSAIAQYKIGDTVSIKLINRMLASAQPAVRPSDAANKIIFLDFWGTGCGTCVESMPKIKDLQDRFKKDLLVLYAYHDDSIRFHKFMKKRTDLEPYRLPMTPVTEEMNILFKHRGIPHIVLIGRDRVIKAITASSYINEDVMASLIKKNETELPYKWTNFDYDRDKAFVVNYPELDIPIKRYSVLIDSVGGIGGGSVWRNEDGNGDWPYSKALFLNYPVEVMYEDLIIKLRISKPQNARYHVIWDSQSVSKEFRSKVYCYEYIVPKHSFANNMEFRKGVLNDLDQQLGLKSEIRTVETDCYLMKLPPTSEGDTSYTEFNLYESTYFNMPVSEIASGLQYQYYNRIPLLMIHDEYGNQRATVRINTKEKSFASLVSQLREQGIELVKVKRPVKVLYIRSVNGG